MGKKTSMIMHTDLYTAEEWYKLTSVEKATVMQQVKLLNVILSKKNKTPEEETILRSFEELHNVNLGNRPIAKEQNKTSQK